MSQRTYRVRKSNRRDRGRPDFQCDHPPPTLETVTRRLMRARCRRFWRQSAAAAALEIPRPSLSLIERGKQRIHLGLLLTMARVYQVSLPLLFRHGGSTDPESDSIYD